MSLLDVRTSARFAASLLVALAPVSAVAHPQLSARIGLTDVVPSPRLGPLVDLDADGCDDLALTAAGRSTLFRFPRVAAPNGTQDAFGRLEPFATVPGADTLWRTDDVDDDGDGDLLAVTVQPVRVYVLENTGAGYGTPRRIDALPGTAVDFQVGDVDGNGWNDIVVTTNAASVGAKGVFVLRRVGRTRYASRQRFTSGAQTVDGVVAGPTRLTDFDLDGDLDAVVVDPVAGSIRLFRNNGAGVAIGPLSVPGSFREACAVEVARIDGDGFPDLVVAVAPELSLGTSRRELRWYRNGGYGDYHAVEVVDDEQNGVVGVEVADLDADGDLDVVCARAGGRPPAWFENDGNRIVPGAHAIDVPDDWIVGEARTADLDGDGIVDIVHACSTHRVGWSRGRGTGDFVPVREVTRRIDGPECATGLDLDGDGDLDVVVASTDDGGASALTLIENGRADGFDAPRPLDFELGAPERIERMVAGDLDGDGDDDLAFASFGDGWLAWAENRHGALLPPTAVAPLPANAAGTMRLADLDGDGALDLVVTSAALPGVRWYRQGPSGLEAQPRTVLPDVVGTTDAAVRDLDGDGRTDLIVTATSSGGSIGWYPGIGGGVFGARVAIPTVNSRPAGVAVLDADGDGDLDVATGGSGFLFPILEWIPQVAPGQFGAAAYVGPSIAGWRHIVVADVDRDGVDDLVACPTHDQERPTEVGIFRAPFGGPYRSEHWPGVVSSVIAVDLDGDGDDDVVVTSRFGDTVDVMLGTARERLGAQGCEGEITSTGARARLEAHGVSRVTENDLALTAYDLPARAFTFFLTSRIPGSLAHPGGSAGTLCLGGAIGRFVEPGEIHSSDASGLVELRPDLTRLPQPSGTAQAVAGETWHFQAWFRDVDAAGAATTNFSDSIAVTLR
ncbi:MAG: VCBS repeat-containing protein [Planctomycetota bacterium]